MNQLTLDDYKEAHLHEIGADSSRSGDTITWEQFKSLYLLILRNQSTLFREIYNGKKIEDLNLQSHLEENEKNIQLCFRVYDADQSGYLSIDELKTFLTEMNLHRQFAKHYNPAQAFESFVYQTWNRFDINKDGKISYDEFITVVNQIMDR